MVKALPRNTIREIDRKAIQELGIAGITLMERAGEAAACEAVRLLQEREIHRLAVVCGTGNNGGDGFVIARKLFAPAMDLKVFVLGRIDELRGDAKHHFDLLRALPVLVESIDSPEALRRFAAAGPLLWIDAIFGTGLSRPVESIERHCIEFMNESGSPILAVDIPSGLDADSGEILGEAIRAQVTVTFVAPKLGFTKQHGPQCAGRVIVDTIGIPESLIR